MSTNKRKQLNILVIIIVGASAFAMLLLGVLFKPQSRKGLDMGEVEAINEGWVLRNYRGNDDKLVELPVKLKAEPDEVLLFMHRLPDGVYEDKVLMFDTKFQNVRVFIGELKVYENGVLNNQKLMRNSVPATNIVDLSYAQPGDIVSIYISSGYKSYSGAMSNVYIGSRGAVVSSILKKHAISFVMSLILVVLAIIFAIVLICLGNKYVDRGKTGYALGFIGIAALWLLLENPIMQLITNNSFGIYVSAVILLLLMPIIYMMYQFSLTNQKRYARIYEIGIYAFGINLLAAVIFQLLSVCDFATYTVAAKGLMICGLMAVTGMLYLSDELQTDKKLRINLYSNILLLAAVLLELILSRFGFYAAVDGLAFGLGLYIYLIILVIVAEKGIIYEIDKNIAKTAEDMEKEKVKAVKNINTGLIYRALALAAGKLKANNMSEGKLIYDTSIYMKCNIRATTDHAIVDFEEELEYIRAYLGIQSKRYPKLDITIEDKVTEFKVPYNTIEPLVENAIENGLLRVGEEGRFVLRSYERLDCFAIQIVDNGQGISPDKLFVSGVSAYRELKEILKDMCGAGIELKCKRDKGSIITVKIPKDGFVIKDE